MKIQVGLSLAFFNRELTSDNKQDYSTSFKASVVTIDELAAHILEGGAWTPATFKKLRRKNDFVQAQIVALDCDDNVSVAKAMLNPAIANYSAIIHATPSSTPDAPRSRIIFVLDSPVTEVDRWELLQRVLIFRFAELKPDRVAKDAARYFYGCRDAECHINSGAALPITALEKYIPDMVATENKQLELAPGSSAAPAIDRAVSYADATFRNSLIELQAAPSGERNATLNKIAYGLFSKARSGEWPGITESTVQAELYQQGLSIGLEKHEVLATIRSAQNAARPQPLILTEQPLLSPRVNGGGIVTSNHIPQPLPITPPDIKIISHEESWSSFLDTLRVGYSSGEVLSVPMEAFHPLDGFCKYIPARKLVGIVAPSSHGKTSFIETWIDRWLQMGISGLLYGPEWTPTEVWQRRMQRHTGLPYTRMLEFEAYKSDLAKGIPPGQCRGSTLSEEERAKAETFKQWQTELNGRLHYVDAPNKTIKTILNGLTEKLRIMREEGQPIGFAVFDYAQIMDVTKDEVITTNAYETAVGMVKSWGEENNIVSIIGSQVTKESSKDRKRGIGGDDALYLRSDKMNLMITLNIEKLNPEDPEDDRLSNRATARVVKNSPGIRGVIPLWTDFKHLTWLQSAPADPFPWGKK